MEAGTRDGLIVERMPGSRRVSARAGLGATRDLRAEAGGRATRGTAARVRRHASRLLAGCLYAGALLAVYVLVGPVFEGDAGAGSAPAANRTPSTDESRHDRIVRHGNHARLYAVTIAFITLAALVIAFIVENTRTVKVSWVFGSTASSLVWVILASALAGWLAGIATSVVFRYRTRSPSRSGRIETRMT